MGIQALRGSVIFPTSFPLGRESFPGENLGYCQAFPFRGMAATPERKVTRAQHPTGLGLGGVASYRRENVEKEKVTPDWT